MKEESSSSSASLIESLFSLCLALLRLRTTVYFEASQKKVIIGEVLGEGAFSFVYAATSSSPCERRKYALKKIFLNSPEVQTIVEMELFALASFKHVNILPLIDFSYSKSSQQRHSNHNYSGRSICLLFPLMERGSLRHFLDAQREGRVRRPSLKSCLTQFNAICGAVQVLHAFSPSSYVHQDIKPDNILISSDGRPLLTDFGSVRPALREVRSRLDALRVMDEAASLSTVSYRAPGRRYSTVLYTVCNVLYVMYCTLRL